MQLKVSTSLLNWKWKPWFYAGNGIFEMQFYKLDRSLHNNRINKLYPLNAMNYKKKKHTFSPYNQIKAPSLTKESFIFNFFKSLFVYQNYNILLSQQILQIDKKKSLIVLFYYTNHPPRTKFRRCIGITSTVRLFFCAIVSNLYLSYQ